jgi:hypothetical protein
LTGIGRLLAILWLLTLAIGAVCWDCGAAWAAPDCGGLCGVPPWAPAELGGFRGEFLGRGIHRLLGLGRHLCLFERGSRGWHLVHCGLGDL